MKNNFLLFLLYSLIFLVSQSCDFIESRDSNLHSDYSYTTDEYQFYLSNKMYQESIIRRANPKECTFDWKIVNVSRWGNLLTVRVEKPQNCDVKYEIISGTISHSYPYQAMIFVKTIYDNCLSDDNIEFDDLIIDLEKAYTGLSSEELDNLLIHIKDFCSLNDINCDGDCNISFYDSLK